MELLCVCVCMWVCVCVCVGYLGDKEDGKDEDLRE